MLVNIFIIDIAVELPLDVTATPQQYKVKCIIAGKNVTKLNFYYDDTDLNNTLFKAMVSVVLQQRIMVVTMECQD